MEANEPTRAVERRRVPRVMRAAAGVACIACVISLYALYHHWAAPYQTKADLRIDRPVMMMCISLALVASGISVWRRYAGRRAFVSYLGAFMMVPALLIAALVMTGVLIFCRPLIAHGAYDAAAAEFSTELARLSYPIPGVELAMEAAERNTGGPRSAEQLRPALVICRDALVKMQQDREDVATLEQRGREMFSRRGVWQTRIDAYFANYEPAIADWCEELDGPINRLWPMLTEMEVRLRSADEDGLEGEDD